MTEQRTMSAREALELIEANLKRLVWPREFFPDERHYLRVVSAALCEREALRKACEAFAQWRTPTARDWDNGAIRDEFNALQQQARAALALAKEGQA